MKARIISIKTLVTYYQKPEFRDSEESIKSWISTARLANWKNTQELKSDYGTASFMNGNKVCFNISGNKYRLIVHIKYKKDKPSIIYIKFIGTHAEYDKIDASTI